MPFLCKVKVCARDSNLSKAQVEEVLLEMQKFYPEIVFDVTYMKTRGDLDKKTSLRDLEKTDFFTKEIDEALLAHACDVAIHSAKDLPHPLPLGLSRVALTKGVDQRDVLVFQDELKSNAIIATSSQRREECVKKLRPDCHCVDIRGTIEERLEMLFSKKIDAVVIAEAALIRLKLTHLSRILLEGKTAPYQGQLAVIARSSDTKMAALFHPINVSEREP